MWMKLSKGTSIALCFVLVSTAMVVLLPSEASAAVYTDETDSDFAQGEFTNTEVVGTGSPASVQLLKNVNNWIQTGPPPDPGTREGPSYCFDEVGGVMVIFGGYHGGYKNDTWEYDYATNTWTEIITAPTPPGRQWGGMVYDSINEVCVLFGGNGGSMLDDTWEYDVVTNSWTETSPFFGPGTMFSNPLAFDSDAGKVIMVGVDFALTITQTWAYDASLDNWVFRTEGSPTPLVSNHALAYDESIGKRKTVFFGGVEPLPPFTVHADTWEYDYPGNSWSFRGTGGPPAVYAHAMTYKPSENAVYLFGGNTGAGYSQATWKRVGAAWSLVSVVSLPPARSESTLVYDSVNDYVIMCCGKDGSGRFNDTWVLGSGYTFMGTFTSRKFDAGESNVNYTDLYLNQSVGAWPADTEIRVRLASSNSIDGPWVYVGPDGMTNTYFNASKSEIPDVHNGNRYIRYQAQLITFDGKSSPALENVSIGYYIIPSPPYLVETYPEDLQFNVDRSTCVFLNFSETMDTTSVDVQMYYLAPTESTGLTFDWTWSGGDTDLRLCPQTPFAEARVVQVWVNGTDMDGMDLIPNEDDPSVVNPFVFVTTGEDPYIVSTSPFNQETDVANDTDVVITWNEPMDTTSVTWAINQGTDPGMTENWDPTDTVLTLSHATLFTECDDLEFEVLTAKDLAGKDFIDIGAPNPWSFKIACVSPYVMWTDPADGGFNVEVNRPITVKFSEPMIPASLAHNIIPSVTLTPTWPLTDELVVNHANFLEGTNYTYCIDDIQDLEGYHLLDRPYCISFMTESNNPYITFATPADGSTGVDPFTDIFIAFSEEMNQGSVTWTITPNVPDQAFWTEEWGGGMGDSTLTLRHAEPMLYCADYTFEVTGGTDLSGYPLIPGLIPNPWSFTTTFEFPCMMDTSPYDGEAGVGLWKEIIVNFSEPIDTTSPFNFDVSPVLFGTAWTVTWSNGDRTVTLNHSLRLIPSTRVDVTISEAYDLDGNPLVVGPVPNPFHFFTIADPNWPWIESTSPANAEQFVPLDEVIVVLFSEEMDTATVTWTVTDLDGPSSIVFTPTWSQTVVPNDTLTLNHVETLRECQMYWVGIGGNDLSGDPLQPHPTDPGGVPNPWSFETVCVFPFIVSTDPVDQDVNVPLNKSITIVFNEEIQTASFLWTIVPDPGGWTETWSLGNTTVTLSHTNDFVQCTPHDVQVTQARDLESKDLVPGPVPNPWRFISECVNPYIVSTDPSHGQTDVPQDYDITVVFSEPMDTGSVVFEIQPGLPFTPSWSGDDTILTISHTDPLLECQLYDAGISAGTDKDGNGLIPGPSPVPNPWSFTTVCIPPYVVPPTYPPNGGVDIPVDAPLIINFSEPMNTTTVSILVDPSPGGWGPKEWANNNMTLWWNHSNNYTKCDAIAVTIQSGRDEVGLDLDALPYKWSFMVECPNPYIVRTDPVANELDVNLDRAIEVEFSDPMDTATVTWTISPDPNPGSWGTSWSAGDTLLVLTHPVNFADNTIHMVTVTGGEDKDGYSLIPGPVPNPWQFKTVAIVGPEVLWTNPTNGQGNVGLMADVIISFTKEIVPGTFHWNFTLGPDPGGWTETWSQTVFPSDTVTLSHSNPFQQLTSYCIRVEHARDTVGQDLESGPYDFCFGTTSILPPPGGLAVTRFGAVRLTWSVVTGATHYNIYDATNKFAPFPSGWNMNQVAHPTNTFDFISHLGDGLNHYYIVRAYDSVALQESANSTMGVKIHKSFTLNPPTMSAYWMSLPFISEYSTASDIANELTETSVNVIAKWDRSKQEVISYYFARGKWRGRDFAIGPGDGIYVSVVSNFSWEIVGTDSDASISLPYSTAMTKNNRHWISVPYTGVYTQAVDIVLDIEGGLGPGTNTYIIEVGLWDPATLSERIYGYGPGGWSGDNFSISPGDGIYLKVVQSFAWSPMLVTPYVA